MNAIRGILGASLGESPAQAAARIDEAKKNANDLTGLIKRKKAKGAEQSGANGAHGNGKRKADDDDESDENEPKKVKVDVDEIVEGNEDTSAKVEDAAEE